MNEPGGGVGKRGLAMMEVGGIGSPREAKGEEIRVDGPFGLPGPTDNNAEDNRNP